MPRYAFLPRAAEFWDGEDCYAADRPSIEVFSDEPQAQFTGPLTANGDRIMRQPDTVPFGFRP